MADLIEKEYKIRGGKKELVGRHAFFDDGGMFTYSFMPPRVHKPAQGRTFTIVYQRPIKSYEDGYAAMQRYITKYSIWGMQSYCCEPNRRIKVPVRLALLAYCRHKGLPFKTPKETNLFVKQDGEDNAQS